MTSGVIGEKRTEINGAFLAIVFTMEIKCKAMPLRHMFHNRSLF
jgi:hypothetical protein